MELVEFIFDIYVQFFNWLSDWASLHFLESLLIRLDFTKKKLKVQDIAWFVGGSGINILLSSSIPIVFFPKVS